MIPLVLFTDLIVAQVLDLFPLLQLLISGLFLGWTSEKLLIRTSEKMLILTLLSKFLKHCSLAF